MRIGIGLNRSLRRAAVVLTSVSLLSLAPVAAASFPDVIPLPNGWQPEGVASGRGTTFYVGSLANGAIYKGDLSTGEGAVLFAGVAGRVSVGLKYDSRSNTLFVAGGGTGNAYVYDADSGALLQTYALGAGFINDVIITREAAYFTNSNQAVLYRLPLGPAGSLPAPSGVETLALTGDFVLQPGFNINGIAATPNGEWLIVVQSNTGLLFRVDPDTGVTTQINLGGATVPNGDGILLDGKTLYVVQNQRNQIAVVALNNDFTAGTVVDTITDSDFRVPTTIAEFGNALYAVNARFGTPPTPTTAYEVVRVEK